MRSSSSSLIITCRLLLLTAIMISAPFFVSVNADLIGARKLGRRVGGVPSPPSRNPVFSYSVPPSPPIIWIFPPPPPSSPPPPF